ncbi:MAG: VWA domain-containing protein [Chloroflexota bacterium]
MRFTYSRWDGAQTLGQLDAGDLIDAMAGDILSGKSVSEALQEVTRKGCNLEDGRSIAGIESILQKVREHRQGDLARYDLDSAVRGLQGQLEEVLRSERSALQRHLDAANADGAERSRLESIITGKQTVLDRVPNEASAAIRDLRDYEFLDASARLGFDALADTLRGHVLERHFKAIRRSVDQFSGPGLAAFSTMLHEFNALLSDLVDGKEVDTTGFLQRHGDQFPGVSTLEEMLGQMAEQAYLTDTMMSGLSAEMRESLEATVQSVFGDQDLGRELVSVEESLRSLGVRPPVARPYPFFGCEKITLSEGLRLMRRMHDLDELERDLQKSREAGNIAILDPEQVRRTVNEETQAQISRLRRLPRVLEEAGYIARNGKAVQLTPAALRKIGQKALDQIFARLRQGAPGEHPIPLAGAGGDETTEPHRFEYGDAFRLDLNQTLMNAVTRGQVPPIQLQQSDFEMMRTERLAESATVLMLDMSRSMPLRGCFTAAKKVALALSTLIRTQFPRDQLYVIVFSEDARLVNLDDLSGLNGDEFQHGTNMQRGFMLARRLLGSHRNGSRQIMLITDGEPTAHLEDGRVQFSYPPSARTFQETLREVQRCTQERILINTFMLERSHGLADFVRQMTAINRGRAFFTTPERLGDYIVVDYVTGRQKRVQVRS